MGSMPVFRLLNLRTLVVQEFSLDAPPAYLAASHAWIETVFGDQKTNFDDQIGGRGIRTVVEQIHPEIEYCWVDKFCIDQTSKQDKLAQIPLMERIFTQARAVVVLINAKIDADQTQVNKVAKELQSALTMHEDEYWEEEGQYWLYGEGRQHIVTAMKGLQRLASTIWATRVWTLQEYVLASTVYWVGLEYNPIRIDDRLIFALPDICDTLAIEEGLTSEMRVVHSHLQGMAAFRLGHIDRTRVMELLGNRTTKKPVDEIYGSMSASGVIIEPVARESKYDAWRRWCEKAITQGHVRWVLLPVSVMMPDDGETPNCILPHFVGRHSISASSRLDHVKPLRTVTMSNGCVSLWARKVGSVKILRRLGKVHEDVTGGVHRDMTLILFAKAKQKLCLQLVSAFGGGRYDLRQAKTLAQVMMQSYIAAVICAANRAENGFRPVFHSEFQLYVWNDFMQLQQSQMIGLNEGIGYLCRITSDIADEDLVTVLVGKESMPEDGLEALDFEARASDNRLVLMVVQGNPRGRSTGILHKVAMTLPVSEDASRAWQDQPLAAVRIGGRDCRRCKGDQARSNSPPPPEGAELSGSNVVSATRVTPTSIVRAFVRQLSMSMRRARGGARAQPWRRKTFPYIGNVRKQRTMFLKKLRRRRQDAWQVL